MAHWVKCNKTDFKNSQICPIWGQSDPIWMPNLTSLFVWALVQSKFIIYPWQTYLIWTDFWPNWHNIGQIMKLQKSGRVIMLAHYCNMYWKLILKIHILICPFVCLSSLLYDQIWHTCSQTNVWWERIECTGCS